VLSGINAGGNLGADVWHSGTVAAIREAVLHGWPGIAVSQYRKRGLEYDWTAAASWTEAVIREIMTWPTQVGHFWNVNLPHLEPRAPKPEFVRCRLDPTPLPLSYREDEGGFHYNGNYHERRREPGADVDVCFGGRIAVTEIALF
jgi:5'-nucleotidase